MPGSAAPNFVLLVGEDMSPDLGCYDVPFARTPNLDRLAAQGAVYRNFFTHCPVCAPSRSGMITGQYPIAIGSHHMRSTLLQPPPLFTQYLQQAGYTVNWANKTDFNFNDQLHANFDLRTDWAAGDLPKEPFFLFYNDSTTHESQVRGTPDMHAKNTQRLTPADRQDPAKIPLPPFYPDTPEVRNDVRQFHELVTAVDYKIGDILDMLDKKGVADNTVVIFIGDHGRGMPWMKRWCYDRGTRIPLIVRWPRNIKPQTVSDQLIAMVDLPATILALAGIPVPPSFHGHPFLGEGAKDRNYVYAHRDRMDEAFDRIRSVRDARYRYVRNYYPQIPYAQYNNYNEENPIMQTLRLLGKAGKLDKIQHQYFTPTKPKEEFYDCQTDPHEVHNLIDSNDPAHREKIKELSAALDQWLADTHDLGAVPEKELVNRGLVADRLQEYAERRKKQPIDPPFYP
jgi:uncharacterized sulfatase